MKIRLGFVSNSSSTSFCIYGLVIQPEEYKKFGWKACEEFGLTEHQEYSGSDSYIVGGSLKDCRDDQTMGDFKSEVRSKLEKFLGRPILETECFTHQDGWYNG